MKKRIIGAIIVVAILVSSILLGEIPFALVVTLSALFGLKELIDIFKSTIEIYRKDNKYYAKQIKNGIYEITKEDFNTIKSYAK